MTNVLHFNIIEFCAHDDFALIGVPIENKRGSLRVGHWSRAEHERWLTLVRAQPLGLLMTPLRPIQKHLFLKGFV